MGPSGARRADLLGSMASRCAPVSQAAPHDFEVVPIAVFAMGTTLWRRRGLANVHVPSLIEPWQGWDGWLVWRSQCSRGVDPPKERHGERRDLRDWEAIRAWATGLPAFAGPPG